MDSIGYEVVYISRMTYMKGTLEYMKSIVLGPIWPHLLGADIFVSAALIQHTEDAMESMQVLNTYMHDSRAVPLPRINQRF